VEGELHLIADTLDGEQLVAALLDELVRGLERRLAAEAAMDAIDEARGL
jgi:hypothetical protein